MTSVDVFAPPVFASVEEERRHRKLRLAAAFRLFAEAGFAEGAAGHITARDPEFPDTFWVNPLGHAYALMRTSDLVRVDDTGAVVEGDRPVNVAAFAIHSQIHAARPDVVAAAHAHAPYGRAISALDVGILPLSQDACAFHGDHAVFEEYTGAVLDVEEGKRIAHALGGRKAIVLRNHGMLTVGGSVESAVWWYLTLERTCQVQLLAMSAGTPLEISPAYAESTAALVGSEEVGRLQFVPIYDRLIQRYPDLQE